MKKLVFTVCLLFILVSACVTTTEPEAEELDWFEMMKHTSKESKKMAWFNSNKTLEECRQDFLECKDDADESIYTPFGSAFSQIPQKVDFCALCMQRKGYKLTLIVELPEGMKLDETPYSGWGIAGR